MTDHDPVAVVRDYLTLTGTRRTDLQGAKWPRGRPIGSGAAMAMPRAPASPAPAVPALLLRPDPLPVGLPAPSARGVFSAMPGGVKLSLALRYAVAPLRRETDRPGVGHRAVASAAALFPVDAFVVASRGGVPETYRCCPDAMALVRDDRIRVRDPWHDANALTLVLVARLARCIEPYGELSPCLALIEAGMIEAQLSLMLGEAGWSVELHPGLAVSAVVESDLHWSDLPVSVISVVGDGAGTALTALERGSVLIDDEPDHAIAEPFDRVRRLLDAIVGSAPAYVPPPRGTRATLSTTWQAKRCLARAAERRSSGNSGPHVRHREMSGAAIDAFLRDVATLAALQPLRESLSPIATIATRSDGGDAARLYAFDAACGPVAFRLIDTRPGDVQSYMPADGLLLVTVGYDHGAALVGEGPGAYATAHLSAGGLVQCFCLAAAAHDLTARPLRSFVQAAADAMLPLAADAVLQIVISAEAPSSPCVTAEPAR